MKKLFCLFFALLILLCSPLSASAHSGKTDSRGGHYNQSTGSYHYHHGYPAHQHTDGVCPYNFDDQTDHSNSGRKTATASVKNESNSGNWVGFVGVALIVLFYVWLYAFAPFTDESSFTRFFKAIKAILKCLFWLFVLTIISIPFLLISGSPFFKTIGEISAYLLLGFILFIEIRDHFYKKRLPAPPPKPAPVPKQPQPLPEPLDIPVSELTPPKSLNAAHFNEPPFAVIPPEKRSYTFGKWEQDVHYSQEQIERMDRAVEMCPETFQYPGGMLIKSSRKGWYTTTLDSCTCKDFEIHQKPCKHIYYLALQQELFFPEWIDIIEEKVSK